MTMDLTPRVAREWLHLRIWYALNVKTYVGPRRFDVNTARHLRWMQRGEWDRIG